MKSIITVGPITEQQKPGSSDAPSWFFSYPRECLCLCFTLQTYFTSLHKQTQFISLSLSIVCKEKQRYPEKKEFQCQLHHSFYLSFSSASQLLLWQVTLMCSMIGLSLTSLLPHLVLNKRLYISFTSHSLQPVLFFTCLLDNTCLLFSKLYSLQEIIFIYSIVKIYNNSTIGRIHQLQLLDIPA